jgi:hypothetical protein
MFPHQYLAIFFIQNLISQTSIILGAEIKNGEHENLFFETQ